MDIGDATGKFAQSLFRGALNNNRAEVNVQQTQQDIKKKQAPSSESVQAVARSASLPSFKGNNVDIVA